MQENGHIFEGLRTIAAYYLRADSSSICECIQTFGLNDLLYSIARLERSFKKTLSSGHRSSKGLAVSFAISCKASPSAYFAFALSEAGE